MQTFKDEKGRSWKILLTLGAVQRIKEECGVDLLAPDQPQFVEALSDIPVIFNMIYVACADQAKEAGVDSVEFCSAMGADQATAGSEAFVEALVNFIRAFRPELGGAMGKIWEKLKATKRKAGLLATKKMDSPAMDRMIAESLAEAEKQIDRQIIGSSSTD